MLHVSTGFQLYLSFARYPSPSIARTIDPATGLLILVQRNTTITGLAGGFLTNTWDSFDNQGNVSGLGNLAFTIAAKTWDIGAINLPNLNSLNFTTNTTINPVSGVRLVDINFLS